MENQGLVGLRMTSHHFHTLFFYIISRVKSQFLFLIETM